MFKRIGSTEKKLLAERLRREALESRPAFSEALHQRVLHAVKQHYAAGDCPDLRLSQNGTAPFAARIGTGRRRLHSLAAALTAACLLCAVAAISWQLLGNASQQEVVKAAPPIPKTAITDLPSIDELTDRAVLGIDHYAVSVALEPQATNLKHDATVVASVFLDRFPVDMKLVDNR